MDVDEKLKSFSDLVIQEAQGKKDFLETEIDKECASAYEEIRNKALRQGAIDFNKAKYKYEQQKSKEISQASSESKRNLINLRNELIDELFVDIREKLVSYTKTDDYFNNLVLEIENVSKRFSGEINIYLTENDYLQKNKFDSFKNITVLKSDVDFIGGYHAVILEENAALENTYLERLNISRNNFVGMKIL